LKIGETKVNVFLLTSQSKHFEHNKYSYIRGFVSPNSDRLKMSTRAPHHRSAATVTHTVQAVFPEVR